MFLPFTLRAKDTSLDQEQKLRCMCGKEVRLGDCLVCWTTSPQDQAPGWYAACAPQCLIVNCAEGNA